MDGPNLRVFSFNELKKVTGNFKHTSILGEGGFGPVYKGTISVAEDTSSSIGDSKFISYLKAIPWYQDHSTETHVAVKRLGSRSFQGLEEWQKEVLFLGSHLHPNLIKLLGYCSEDKELLLVYEYMPNRSLADHLYNARSLEEPLAWKTRVSIALGAARGLAFLHSQDRPIIFRDLKASDILLDKNFNAKISDFGVAKLGPSGENSHVSTQVVGSGGICAPEYICTGHLYVKSDVYMFGVVLLEILTGLRATKLSDKKRLDHIMDGRLKEDGYTDAFQMAQLTLRCLRMNHIERPGMVEVVEILESIHGGK